MLYFPFGLWLSLSIIVSIINLHISSNKEKDILKAQYFKKLMKSKKYNLFYIISSVLFLSAIYAKALASVEETEKILLAAVVHQPLPVCFWYLPHKYFRMSLHALQSDWYLLILCSRITEDFFPLYIFLRFS